MWKIFCHYSDKSKVTITGKNEIDLRLAIKYYKQYGATAVSCIFQQYPKKSNEAKLLHDVIEELTEKEGKKQNG